MTTRFFKHCLAATAAAVIVTLGTPGSAPAAPYSTSIVAVGVGTLSATPNGDTSLVDAFSGVLRRLARALTLRRN